MIDVRPGRLPKRVGSSGGGNRQSSAPLVFPAPKLGLVTNAGLSDEISGAASVLDNWWPTIRGARIRGGSAKVGQVDEPELSADILSAFRYRFAGAEKLFMATETAIYDVSNPPLLPDTIPISHGSLLGGAWSTFQHATEEGGFLIALNGVDDRLVFNGTLWSSDPEITFDDGDDTTTANFSHGWLFKRREFFIKSGTLDAYYIEAAGAIGGAVKVFPLGGVFTEGGTLLTGFTWSLTSGDGPNAYCVFVTTEGEAAVYAGDDPGGENFGLQGVYQIGKPLGKNAYIRVGADVWISTMNGCVSLSDIVQAGEMSLPISQPIEEEWGMAASASGGGWQMTFWDEQKLILISFPSTVVVPDTTFVIHSQTKRWALIRNWPSKCFGVKEGRLFFGGLRGLVWAAETSGSDDGAPFQASYLSQFIAAGKFGQRKTATLAHMYFRGKDIPRVKLFARADGDTGVPTQSAVSIGDTTQSVWDVARWDEGIWDDVSTLRRFDFRQDVGADGETLAIGAVITSGGPVPLTVHIDLGTMQVSAGEASA